MKKITSGFTLIELVITVAIVAVLAAIAYPSYQDSVRKSRRADAKSILLQAGQFMERFYTENNCYSNQRDAAGVICAGAAVALPAGLSQSPTTGVAYYVITLPPATLTPTAFILTATPQAAGGQNQDRCGGLTGPTLNLNQAGQKGVNGAFNTPAIIQDCWR